jgi:nicotinamide mononucleotide transporter
LRWTTDDSFPLSDAFTTAFSLVGQWMMNEKLLENWVIWLLVDLVYVPMFLFGHRQLTAGLYALFCVMACRGYVEWKRSLASGASV